MKNFEDISGKLKQSFSGIKRYLPLLFCVLLVVLYAFVAYRVRVLDNAQPSPLDVATQTKVVQVPRIDPQVVSQLKNLQDNSVNVQALFNQARNNPFNE